MNFNIDFIKKPNDKQRIDIIILWQKSFGDTKEFIESFMMLPSWQGAVCAFDNEKIISTAHMLALSGSKKGWYGYAVSTDKEYRGRGACAEIHEYIKSMCNRENAAYLLHPAEESLSLYYKKLGLDSLGYTYCAYSMGDGGEYYKLTADEYKYMRELYFKDEGYYGWDSDVLSLLISDDDGFFGFDIDNIQCAACVSGTRVLEICAPPQLEGRAVKRAASTVNNSKVEIVFRTKNPIDAKTAVMGYNYKPYSYFNLFLE